MHALQIVTLFLLTVAGKTFSQNNNTKCPFQFLYHFGDAISDIGNSVKIPPFGPGLPPTRSPYGVTFPGLPTGRWSDGFVDVDYVAQAVGLPNIKPYLSLGPSPSNDGVIFSVEGSTVLNNSFFSSKGIIVPPYNTPLSTQFSWFTTYLRSICTSAPNQTDCVKRQLQNSAVLIEFAELNDLGYALVQGKSIQEVSSYVPLLVQAQVDAAREVIKLGATRFLYTTAAPLGCYPYILTALSSNDTLAYDGLGCLSAVNSLAAKFNAELLVAFKLLLLEFPFVTILPADYYVVVSGLILEKNLLGLLSGSTALKSCCGIGGRYNYDSTRFCGSPNVPFCPNPKDYIYWDGLHFTQEVYRRVIGLQAVPALLLLGCRLI